ncbi:MAG: isoleucine--tRNA ligase [Bacteroidota bacterium]
MKFAEYQGLDLSKVATDILEYWETHHIFEESITTREDSPSFVFYEGPPSANGLPGIHHVMARAIKDIFCRYKTQKGYQVKRKAGWDTHGLPIELGVEKELGITKEDIGRKISIEAYNKACKKAVMRYTDVWHDLTRKIGYWVNMDDPYITYKSKYMESVWWLLKQIYDKGLLYKGYTIQPYSPKAGTGLSSHELNQPGTYKEVSDTTVVAQFKAKAESLPEFLNDYSDIYFLAWTTTPWTLPSNTALTVGPKIDYVVVRTFNQYTFRPIHVLLAKTLVEKQFTGKYSATENDSDFLNFKKEDKKIPYQLLTTCKGSDLTGIKYEQLLSYAQPYQNPENAFRVIAGDFVTTEEGTGIVHTAPTFGADDAKVAKEARPEVPPMLIKDEHHNLVPLVDLQGRFRAELPEIGGKYVKNDYYKEGEAPERSVDVEIAIKLKEENKAFKVEKYVHSYPHCWRTDKPVLYYPLDSWFIKVTEVRDRMYELNKTINWKPKSTGEGRFGNWLQNANDWNLSRSRFWGTPLPIWRTEDGKEEIIIGSVAELKAEMAKAVHAGIMENDLFPDFVTGDMSEENYDNIDLHKNIVDQIILVSPSGRPMKRETDLIDVWFDSGAMPYAQWHYPFELPPQSGNEKEEASPSRKDLGWAFPADYIAEGVDQTRGWFYTLHAIGILIFDAVAYKNVISNGLVLDKNGQKMSKRLGNAADPFETLEHHGPDATRWYMISNANPWDNLKFNIEGIAEVRRKFFGTLYNTYAFFSLYANIDGFTYTETDIPLHKRPEIDRWILSELHTLIRTVDDAYDDYEPTKAARALSEFTQEHLSNWFVRLSRRRFWKGDYGEDKISAYQTLYNCLITIAKLSAPIAPFYMDRLYQDLNNITGKEQFKSVHLSYFPKFDLASIDTALERKMKKAQSIASLVLALRKKEGIKVRQPLQKIMIPVLDDIQKDDILAVAALIRSEVNIKEIELIDDASGILVKQTKPNFKVLGPRFGKDIGLISNIIRNFNQEDIRNLEKNKAIAIAVNGKNSILGIDDVEITSQDIEGWLVASSGELTVALDITITDTLKKEGIARELVNRIQNLRKDSGLDVTDKITIKLQKDGLTEQAVLDNLAYIKNETLATALHFEDDIEEGVNITFDDTYTKLYIEKQ